MTRRRRGQKSALSIGVASTDLYQWHKKPAAVSVPDERRGRTFCKECGAEVEHVQVNGEWHVRNSEDGLPHRLSCGTKT